MKLAIEKSSAERAVELAAALSLGAALAVAIWLLIPAAGGVRALAAGLGGVVAAMAGFVLICRFEAREPVAPGFAPAVFEFDDVLLLDDPIARDPAESRVVRLFGREPGEMVARIDAFLDAGEGTSRRSGSVGPDARAALHAALAEIRQSLR